MTVRSFVDTSVLVYADDAGQPKKQSIALKLLATLYAESNGVLSVQVLQEYFAAATRKLGVAADVARHKVAGFAAFEVVQTTSHDVLAAIDLHRLHGMSIWDALIVRAAINARCKVLLTEDMQDGRMIDGLRIENPFAARAEQPTRKSTRGPSRG